MANRQTFPSSLFPLNGDVNAQSGAIIVEVTGLQNIPLGTAPTKTGQVPTYDEADNVIDWTAGAGSAVLINGVPSGDYLISVNTALTINYDDDNFLGIRINGVSDGG